MSTAPPLVIVGASYAGVQIAATARELGFSERIVLVGDEVHAPYQRPPLSKGLLTGKTRVDQLALRGPAFFDDNRIELLLGFRAETLDAGARTVTLDNGATLAYGWLALTTGARCRPFACAGPAPAGSTSSGADLAGVFQLRTLDDALHVAAAADRAQRACVIGGGFVGLEVAAALSLRGIAVTIVEAQPRLLMRGFQPALSDYVAQAHRLRGTQVLTGRVVRALHGAQGRVASVEFDDGVRVDTDLVVLGIGVLPNAELAARAGLAVDNGIVVDMLGRTSAPQVLAVGDVANMALPPAPGAPARMRLESIQAANDGAKAAASLLVGHERACASVPWFWSDQFHLKFQMAGLPLSSDLAVLRGELRSDRFSVFYLRGGALVAAHSVNKPAEHMQSRKLIGARARLTPDQLADESFDLRTALQPT